MPSYTGSFGIFGSGRRYEEIKKNSSKGQQTRPASKPQNTQQSYERDLLAQIRQLKPEMRLEFLNKLRASAVEDCAKARNLDLKNSKDYERAYVEASKVSPLLFSQSLLAVK